MPGRSPQCVRRWVHRQRATLGAMSGRIRVVVAKPGLDGHDRGAKVIARALRDAGMEVVYTGLHQTPEQIVQTVIQEDADAVGLSVLSGAHMTLFAAGPRAAARAGASTDVVVFGGGIIPERGHPRADAGSGSPRSSPRAPRWTRSSSGCANVRGRGRRVRGRVIFFTACRLGCGRPIAADRVERRGSVRIPGEGTVPRPRCPGAARSRRHDERAGRAPPPRNSAARSSSKRRSRPAAAARPAACKLAATPQEAQRKAAERSSAWTSRVTPCTACW